MRIIYLHQYFNDPSMPGGTRSHEVAARLGEAGHEVHVITSDREQRTRHRRTMHKYGYTTHWLGVPYRNDMSAAYRPSVRGIRRQGGTSGLPVGS